MRGRRGATLLELVLVMMVLLTLAAVVAPRFSDFFPALQLRRAAATFFSTAGKARADAVLGGVRHRLVVDPAARTYWIAWEPRPFKEPGRFEKLGPAWEEELPRDVVLEALEGFGTEEGRRFLDFLPDGSARQASLVLANDRGDRRTIRIAAATGVATIEAAEATSP